MGVHFYSCKRIGDDVSGESRLKQYSRGSLIFFEKKGDNFE
jgi:hypothetical protein